MSDPAVPIEIERKYLLSGVPRFPANAQVIKIEQGYLQADDDDAHVGRVRRSTFDDGRVICKHTVKRGSGLVREEIERELTDEQFADFWPQTEGRRLTKTRHVLTIGDVVWMIDVFDQIDLVIAEAEVPTVDTPSPAPAWLEPLIVREVTEDPAYTNANLAQQIAEQAARP